MFPFLQLEYEGGRERARARARAYPCVCMRVYVCVCVCVCVCVEGQPPAHPYPGLFRVFRRVEPVCVCRSACVSVCVTNFLAGDDVGFTDTQTHRHSFVIGPVVINTHTFEASHEYMALSHLCLNPKPPYVCIYDCIHVCVAIHVCMHTLICKVDR
jgi:hypothetical protein